MAELLPLRLGTGLVGLIDWGGRWVVEPRFDFAARFSEGRALFRSKGRYGFIDERGEVAVPAEFTGANWFSGGFSCAAKAGLHAFIDSFGARLDAPPLEAPASFKESLAVIRTKGRMRVIRPNGTFAHPREVEFARPFSEGLSAAFDDGQWQYLDANGDTALKVSGAAESFSEGLAPVRSAKGFGFINRAGETVIAGPFATAMPFSFGRALVQRRGRFGFIDSKGQEVIACRYAAAERFASGRAWVKETPTSRPNAIDTEGNTVFTAPEGFSMLAPFLNGVALIAKSEPATNTYLEHYVFADGRVLEV